MNSEKWGREEEKSVYFAQGFSIISSCVIQLVIEINRRRRERQETQREFSVSGSFFRVFFSMPIPFCLHELYGEV